MGRVPDRGAETGEYDNASHAHIDATLGTPWTDIKGEAIYASRATAPHRDGKWRFALYDGSVYAICLANEDEQNCRRCRGGSHARVALVRPRATA